MRSFYYAITDHNGVLCVDQIDQQNENTAQVCAETYPDAIYFCIDNVMPEFRVPLPEQEGDRDVPVVG